MSDNTSLFVSALAIHPVKGCAQLTLTQAAITPRGFAGDREFMVINAGTGRFLTQREIPRLAVVQPRLTPVGLTLHAPGTEPISVTRTHGGVRRPVTVWKDVCPAVDQGDSVAQWLSEFLGTPSRLVTMAPESTRTVDPMYAARPTDEVGFADGYPYLVLSEASLAGLNARLATPLPMNRFRANIVIAGGEPHVEDTLRAFRVGDVTFRNVKPCARCVVTTTHQARGERDGREPLTTLARYRRAERGGMLFGQNAVAEGSSGSLISVGDGVDILEFGTPPALRGTAEREL